MYQQVNPEKIEPHIYFIDSRKFSRFGVSGIYIVIGSGVTLIETGTALIGEDVLEGIGQLGFAEKDIRNAVLTHVHLDHAGGTGWLVRRLPHLKVYVHERGYKHIHDPSTLIESAKILYDTLENIIAIHGQILPVSRNNLISVTETKIDIGEGVCLEIFDTPGHAPHHLCVFEPESGCVFAGESLGHYHPELNLLQPAVAPPGFDYEASLETIGKIKARNPRTICFSQYGYHRDPEHVIEKSKKQLADFYGLIKTMRQQGLDTNEIVQEIANLLHEGTENEGMSSGSMLRSIVVGYDIYFQRKENKV
jgi:glyoxylase-like metal-dependent hydrolase (beta-lactamase superfamily II)